MTAAMVRATRVGAIIPHVPTLFVAVAKTGAQRVMKSLDGINWTLHTCPLRAWTAICWNGSLFCAVASDGSGDTVMTSPNGSDWTARTPAANLDWESVCWNGTYFVAGAHSGLTQRIMTSSDGVTWTLRDTPGSNWDSLASNGAVTVSVAESIVPTNVIYSLDKGLTWVTATSPDVDAAWGGVAWDGTNFVAVESGTSSGPTKAATSPDGINWTSRSAIGSVNGWESVAAGGGIVVAVAVDVVSGKQVMVSTDHGVTWTGFASSVGNTWRGLAWNGKLFAAVADIGSGTRVMTSVDGQAWVTRASPADNNWSAICSTKALF